METNCPLACKVTAKIWSGEYSRKLPSNIQEKALDRFRILNAAVRLDNLLVPPGNKLESLKGDRKGQHSIRINGGFVLCGQMATRMTWKLWIITK